MSVDTKLYQVTLEELELFSKDRNAYLAFMDKVDDSYFFPTTPPSADQRMLFLDEFSKSLLADTRDDIYCVSRATTFAGSFIKWGEEIWSWMPYHSSDEVKELAEELEAYPLAELFARLDGIMEQTRINATGFLDGDEAIRNYQIKQWNKVVGFYRRAADANRAVIVDVG